MATHFDRVYCGKCTTTYLVSDPQHQQQQQQGGLTGTRVCLKAALRVYSCAPRLSAVDVGVCRACLYILVMAGSLALVCWCSCVRQVEEQAKGKGKGKK